MRGVSFSKLAFEQYSDWASENAKTFIRIRRLVEETCRTPFEGTGKPEPLKHQFKGKWSRRITDEHRLVYEVSDSIITIISCKYHYDA
jgi:toxin YoeB